MFWSFLVFSQSVHSVFLVRVIVFVDSTRDKTYELAWLNGGEIVREDDFDSSSSWWVLNFTVSNYKLEP